MSDLISRQAAIEDVKSWVAVDGREKHLQKDVIEWLKEFPSARPERTCVNCGKTVNNGGWYADGRTRCPIEEHYCGNRDCGYVPDPGQQIRFNCPLWRAKDEQTD